MVSVLARRTAFERAGLFDESLRSCEDFDMWLRCSKSGSRIIYHSTILVRYRRRAGSLSSNDKWMQSHGLQVLNKMRTAVSISSEERDALERAIRRFEGRMFFSEGKRAFLSGDIPTAIDRLGKSRRLLRSPRVWMISIVVSTLPSVSRVVYVWKSRLNGIRNDRT